MFSVLQLMHNWQHTGQQKELFARSADLSKITTGDKEVQKIIDDEIKQMATCPFQCGEKESYLSSLHALQGQESKRQTS